jgi:imidazolonepropionase
MERFVLSIFFVFIQPTCEKKNKRLKFQLTPMKTDLMIYNARLVTCASNGNPKRSESLQDVGLIENGAVAVSNGKITAVGKSEDILRGFKSENLIDAGGKVVCPAFVESHTHIVFAGNRLDEFELKIKGADYLEILANGGGILSTVHQTREASLGELVEQSRRRLNKMLTLGVGTCEIKTGYGLDTETELKMLEVILELDKSHAVDIVPTFMPAHTVPPEFKEKADEYVYLICNEMLPKAKQTLNSRLSTLNCFVDVFCEKNAFDLMQSRKVLETAKSLGFGLKAHVDQFTNLGGAQMAIELGAASIDHLDTISDEEIKLLANSKTIGITTPTCNFNFGETEFADARKLIDAGCAVAVSTDYNPGSAPCPSLPNAMSIACRYQKLLPSEAFNAITINAAFAVGLGEKVGSIEVGKQADLLILETQDYRETTYEFGGNFVEKVIKNGKFLDQ